jgi:hypothetical protein
MDRPIMPLGSYVPGALYAIWREALGSSLAASTPNRGVKDVRTADRTETVATRSVTADFFRVLGVGPSLGRLSQEDPADSTGPAPAVLSYRVWQRLFAGDRGIVLHNNIMNDALQLDARIFCTDMIEAGRAWYIAKKEDPCVVANSPKLIQYYPNGLSPYIEGIPLIA